MAKTKVEVETKTFVRFWLVILGFILALAFLWKALPGLIVVGIAAVLAIAIWPLGEKINRRFKKKRPKLASGLAFLIVLVIVGVAVSVIGPVVVGETTKVVGQMPSTFQNVIGGWDGINEFGQNFGIEDLQGSISQWMEDASASILSGAGNVVMSGVGAATNVVTGTILVLVLTLLFLLEGPALVAGFWKLLAGKEGDKNEKVGAVKKVVFRMRDVVATYVAKQVTIGFLDGCVVALVVFILSLAFGFSTSLALPMGLLATILYLIPMFGPVIACILITLVLLVSSPFAGILFAVIYIVYLQIESNLIAPHIQGAALNLSPLIILIAVTIGIYMFGLLGAIIAIPIAGCVKVLIEEYPHLKKT